MCETSHVYGTPVAFIVEGTGEYVCYPSLFCRITGHYGKVHVLNADGNGRILSGLCHLITNLCLACHPHTVVITLDLKDVIRKNICSSCIELKERIDRDIEAWREESLRHPRLDPLPQAVVLVIQIQKLETWFIADVGGLARSQHVCCSADEQVRDVDDNVKRPDVWLRDHMTTTRGIKNPTTAREMVSCLRPDRMRDNSRSFDKFYREVTSAYCAWAGDDRLDVMSPTRIDS